MLTGRLVLRLTWPHYTRFMLDLIQPLGWPNPQVPLQFASGGNAQPSGGELTRVAATPHHPKKAGGGERKVGEI